MKTIIKKMILNIIVLPPLFLFSYIIPKNKNLIIEHLANKPSKRFFKLAKKHNLDLETFL